jgi:SAM-dependent methyltransferase
MRLFHACIVVIFVLIILKMVNWISYKYLKGKTLKSNRWDLNICCGKTDGGGINADIVKHADLPSFVLIKDIYNLPFETAQFKTVLCSHTMEHVENPTAFLNELNRVGVDVTLVIPPLWDVTAALNIFEHRWVFLTFKTEHTSLPLRIYLPFADILKYKLLIEFIKA